MLTILHQLGDAQKNNRKTTIIITNTLMLSLISTRTVGVISYINIRGYRANIQ